MDTPSENLITLLESLAKELPAAVTMWRIATLLPADSIPWLWLQEITAAHHPDLTGNAAEFAKLQRHLVETKLLTQTQIPEVARMPDGAAYFRGFPDASNEQEFGLELRALVWRRLQDFKVTKKQLTDEVMRLANGGKEVTAWTVPTPAAAVVAAADNKLVHVTDNGDGSFNIGLRKGALWEEACLQNFCKHQFESNKPDAMEWALRSGLIPSEDIECASDRITEIYEKNPTSAQTGIIQGLLLLNLAHAVARKGSWRGAWHHACGAVNVLAEVSTRDPQNAEISDLLKEAERCKWLYDD